MNKLSLQRCVRRTYLAHLHEYTTVLVTGHEFGVLELIIICIIARFIHQSNLGRLYLTIYGLHSRSTFMLAVILFINLLFHNNNTVR